MSCRRNVAAGERVVTASEHKTALRAAKKALDPQGLLNPGVLIDPFKPDSPTVNDPLMTQF